MVGMSSYENAQHAALPAPGMSDEVRDYILHIVDDMDLDLMDADEEDDREGAIRLWRANCNYLRGAARRKCWDV